MADNSTLPATGDVIAADDVGGVKHQLVKIEYGADGVATPVTAITPLPVTGAVTVSGGLTDTELRASAVPVSLASVPSHAVTNAGTFATQAAQSGTWTVQPGNTANTTAWLVTGTGGTFPVTQGGTWNITNVSGTISLPTGAATAAKQPALGTAGVSSADVISVQGIASGTAMPVSLASVPSHAVTNAGTFAVQATDNITQLGGTTIDTNSGVKSAGTLRVVLATDQPALTNKLLVTPDSVALPNNQSVNVSQINAVTPLMGNGVTGTGSQRVTIASDNTAFSVNAVQSGTYTVGLSAAQTLATVTTVSTVTNLSQLGGVAIAMNTGVRSTGTQRVTIATDDLVPANISQINGVTPLMGNGATGTGALRVSIANDSTGIVALPAAGTSIVGTKAAGTAGATSALTGAVYNSTTPALTDGQQAASQADTTGAVRINAEGGKATYRATIGTTLATNATDFFELQGSGTKTIRITRIELGFYNGTAARIESVYLLRRSTAGSAGTSTTITAAKMDTNNAAATAVCKENSGVVTVGTQVAFISGLAIGLPLTGTPTFTVQPSNFWFGDKSGQGLVVRGTSDFVVVGFAASLNAGATVTGFIEWTEE